MSQGFDRFRREYEEGVEVGTAFDVCGEKDYSRLRQAGKLPKPVDACSRDQLLLVQRYAAIYQEDEEPALVIEERLGESVVHNHGFWPMKEMPYIVARPRAIILPEMGLHDTCTLLDVYELDNFGGCPDAIPQYAGIIPKTTEELTNTRSKQVQMPIGTDSKASELFRCLTAGEGGRGRQRLWGQWCQAGPCQNKLPIQPFTIGTTQHDRGIFAEIIVSPDWTEKAHRSLALYMPLDAAQRQT
ncbi:hypothetical protein PSENEW3n2_00005106 [Picochlorum sp. SENEW3]|nr:hypothetical protein PSENEW3n2_00005106 [Picochlorum sp. SENEW3]WPT17099.1 hypothetical protein PSENEW3_00005106 [Picochlorum sp. SENEW3]